MSSEAALRRQGVVHQGGKVRLFYPLAGGAASFAKTFILLSLLVLSARPLFAEQPFGTYYQTKSGSNLYIRIALDPDTNNFFTFDEGINLPLPTRFTSLGGGSNAWKYLILDPAGTNNVDPTLQTLGTGGTNWNFAVSSRLPHEFWRARKLTNSPGGSYLSFGYAFVGTNLQVHFDLTPDLTGYYLLESGTNLGQFTPQVMAYGGGPSTWSVSLATTQVGRMFWRVRRFSAATPLDADGDGLDDVFELTHGLNPLDSTDATNNSGLVDANNNPLTWLGAYHYYFVNNIKIYDAVSREVSSFNFAQPTANYEAFTREVSAFNVPGDTNRDGIDDAYEINHNITPATAGQPSGFTTDFPNDTGQPLTWVQLYRLTYGQNRTLYDTVGREMSVFNFGQGTANYEAVSRETSVFNFGQPTANYEAISREVSVFNVPGTDANHDGIDDAYALAHGITNAIGPSGFTSDFPNDLGTPLSWVQLYRTTFGQNPVLYSTVSREISVFNYGQPTANYEAISREISIFNQP